MPESRGRGLHLRESRTAPPWSTNLVAVFHLEETTVTDVSDRLRSGEALPEDRYLVAVVERAGNSPWTGNRCYVDLLHPGVGKKFIEVTLGAYQREIGREFGRRVPGIFTDEPNIIPAGGLPWTDDLPEQYARRWGASLVTALPSLVREVGDWRQVRHHYYQTLLDLFIERWAMPYYTACTQLGLQFTGHYWEHEWPHCHGVPDNMAMAAWQHRPGIDTLMNQYAEHTHAQFGNVRAAREISSIANQFGRARTLVEIYGAGGWDLRFEDMKRIGDWLQVLGVNTLDEHLSYITLRGARKRDHPQSFSYHEPWWPAYHTVARYFTRISAALSQGDHINLVLVLEPTTTAWMYQNHPGLDAVGDSFFRLLMALESAQIEYDLLCEDVVSRIGGSVATDAADRPVFVIGRRAYDIVVLPPHAENLNGITASTLEEYIRLGGRVLGLGQPPQRIDGKLSDDIAPFLDEFARPDGPILQVAGTSQTIEAAAVDALRRLTADDPFRIERAAGDRGILFHHRRRLADGQLLFLVNTSLEHPSAGKFRAPGGGAELWDPHSGATEPCAFGRSEQGVEVEFSLPPAGSQLYFVSQKLVTPAPSRQPTRQPISPAGAVRCRRLEPNVLTIDYVDVTAGGQSRSNQYFYAAQQFACRQNGLERNPWDNAVQFKDEILQRTFPPDSGFEVSYRFSIDGPVPMRLEIVFERPDLYTITCNGTPVKPTTKAWWLDKAFGRVDLSQVARTGPNVVTLKAAPLGHFHELEPAYVLGDFALRADAAGFTIVPEKGLQLGSIESAGSGGQRLGWDRQGYPFYAQGVGYQLTFPIAKPKGSYQVTLPSWYGSVARVDVNGKTAGYVGWAPAQLDVTRWIKKGNNQVEVVVIGTLKNTLGPHHGKPGLGSAWPSMFQKGPTPGPPAGQEYHTVSYGLFAPFALEQVLAN